MQSQQFLSDVAVEVARARKLFPTLAALTEEVGELAQALIDHDRGTQCAAEVYAEAVQVAAMAMRVATEGDASFSYRCPL